MKNFISQALLKIVPVQEQVGEAGYSPAGALGVLKGQGSAAPALRLCSSLSLQMKTVSVALVLCLNVGVDPPDVVKTTPCARLECWIGECSLP